MWATGGYTCFHILQLGLQNGASIGECPTFQKKFGDQPINLAPSRKKENPTLDNCLALVYKFFKLLWVT
jgi:hypothetical protein